MRDTVHLNFTRNLNILLSIFFALRKMNRSHEKSLEAEVLMQEQMVVDSIACNLSSTPVRIKASTFFIHRGLGLNESPSTCKMTIYGTRPLVGPFDESSVVNLLFPQNIRNTRSIKSYFDNNKWSQVSFAELTEYRQPSMAIYSEHTALEISWIGRIYYRNPQHAYDYQVHVALAP